MLEQCPMPPFFTGEHLLERQEGAATEDTDAGTTPEASAPQFAPTHTEATTGVNYFQAMLVEQYQDTVAAFRESVGDEPEEVGSLAA
jgi:hypothetical protein